MSNNKLVADIEPAAQSVLDARAANPESSLPDLYGPIARAGEIETGQPARKLDPCGKIMAVFLYNESG